jgi:hypothetical protein
MTTEITWIRKDDGIHFVSTDEKILHAKARLNANGLWTIKFHSSRPQGLDEELDDMPFESLQYWALAVACYHAQEVMPCVPA